MQGVKGTFLFKINRAKKLAGEFSFSVLLFFVSTLDDPTNETHNSGVLVCCEENDGGNFGCS